MKLRLVFVTLLACLLFGCSSIKIESATTTEDMANKNEMIAKEMRINWSQQMGNAGDKGQVRLLKNHIDSTSTIIINYGFRVADEWRKGNFGRGEEIDAAEMRRIVDAWVAEQKPILKAFEDNMEYGVRLVQQSKMREVVVQDVYSLLDSLADTYYDTYSVVFYPNHNVEIYEEELQKARDRHRYFMDKLEPLLRVY